MLNIAFYNRASGSGAVYFVFVFRQGISGNRKRASRRFTMQYSNKTPASALILWL
jgi:hypothetical protein